MINITQTDFGGFDPSFIGISVRFPNDKSWTKFYNSISKGLLINWQDMDDADKFETIAITTILPHEVKHFHDFLISGHGARLFRFKVMWLINAWQTIHFITKLNGNMIPVPITKWCRMNKTQRSDFLNSLPKNNTGEDWKPVDLPYIVNDDVTNIARQRGVKSVQINDIKDIDLKEFIAAVFLNSYEIEKLYGSSNAMNPFEPWQILELSGILVHLQYIANEYGIDISNFFLNKLSEMPTSPYTETITATRLYFAQLGSELNIPVLSSIATWSLLGNYNTEDYDKAHPSLRFVHALEYIKNKGLNKLSNIHNILSEFSEKTERCGVNDGLNFTLDLYSDIQERLTDLIDQEIWVIPDDEFLSLVKRVCKSILTGSRFMIEYFKRNPVNYFEPYHYIKSRKNQISPTVRFECQGIGLHYRNQPSGLIPITALSLPEYEKPVNLSFSPGNWGFSEHRLTDPNDIVSFYKYISICEYVYSEKNRFSVDVQMSGQKLFKDIGFEPIEVF